MVTLLFGFGHDWLFPFGQANYFKISDSERAAVALEFVVKKSTSRCSRFWTDCPASLRALARCQ
jgi:hypothetical protein